MSIDIRPLNLRRRLDELMVTIPELSDFGIGQRGGTHFRAGPLDRELLRSSLPAIERAMAWLGVHVKPVWRINQNASSYGLKTLAQADIGSISNGAFIAAAILAGYTYAIPPYSPNVRFGMSRASLKHLMRKRRCEKK